MIAGLVLAAGRSTRFGGDKLTAMLGAQPVVRWSVSALQEMSAVYVVVGIVSDGVRAALDGLDVVFVENPVRDEGMASSIRAGIAALPDTVEAVVIALGDQPLISPHVIRQVRARWRAADCAAVIAEYTDGRGHPVLFGRECFSALAEVHGEVGARAVLMQLAGQVAVVSVNSKIPIDVDTWAALERVSVQAQTGRMTGDWAVNGDPLALNIASGKLP